MTAHYSAVAVRMPCTLRASPAYRDMVAGSRPRIRCLPPAVWDALAARRGPQDPPVTPPAGASPSYQDVETFVMHRLLQREVADHARLHYVDLDDGVLVVSKAEMGTGAVSVDLLRLLKDTVTRVLGVQLPSASAEEEVYPMTVPCAYAPGAFLVDPESAAQAVVRRFGRECAASVTAAMFESEAWQAIS